MNDTEKALADLREKLNTVAPRAQVTFYLSDGRVAIHEDVRVGDISPQPNGVIKVWFADAVRKPIYIPFVNHWEVRYL